MDGLVQPEDVVAQVGAASCCKNLDAAVLTHFDANLRSLKGQFSRWYQNESLHFIAVRVDSEKRSRDYSFLSSVPFDEGNKIGSRLARSVLGSGENIATGERNWNRSFLNGGGALPAFLVDAHENVPL